MRVDFIIISLFSIMLSFLWADCFGQSSSVQAEINKEFTLTMKSEYKYVLQHPPSTKPSEKLPLIVFLHGAGERGDDLGKVKVHGPWTFLQTHPEYRFIVLAPQCKEGEFWDPYALDALLDEIVENHPVDPYRIYLTGLSMGGFGTWDWAMVRPDRFAALAPVCGASNLHRLAAQKVKHIPIWVFHGALDESVPYELSARVVRELETMGADVAFTVYPLAGHDSWTETYLNRELYDWFLQQRLGNSKSQQKNNK
jgi:predicted peptidase